MKFQRETKALEPGVLTAEARQSQNIEEMLTKDRKDDELKEINDQIQAWGQPIANPKQKHCFVTQRRVQDSWGRLMLFKPNRKVFDYTTWLFYDYYVNDSTKKLFGISLLSDENQTDAIPLSHTTTEEAKGQSFETPEVYSSNLQ